MAALNSGGLPLELEMGLVHLVEGKLHSLTRLGFDPNVAVLESGKRAVPVPPAFHRLPEREFGLLPAETFVVLRLEQLTLHAWRADLQRVPAALNHVFDIQNRAYLLGNQLAIGMRYASGFVDRNPDEPLVTSALHFDFDHLQTFGAGHPLRNFFDFRRHCFPHRSQCAKSNKKVGLRPLHWLDVPPIVYRGKPKWESSSYCANLSLV